MELTEQGFEDFLKDTHSSDYMGTDDDMQEAFEKWLEHSEFLLKSYAHAYAYKQGELYVKTFLEESKKLEVKCKCEQYGRITRTN